MCFRFTLSNGTWHFFLFFFSLLYPPSISSFHSSTCFSLTDSVLLLPPPTKMVSFPQPKRSDIRPKPSAKPSSNQLEPSAKRSSNHNCCCWCFRRGRDDETGLLWAWRFSWSQAVTEPNSLCVGVSRLLYSYSLHVFSKLAKAVILDFDFERVTYFGKYVFFCVLCLCTRISNYQVCTSVSCKLSTSLFCRSSTDRSSRS